MPIEFRCSQCGKLLRTGDETAGRQAQCPQCQALTKIPESSEASGSPPPLAPLLPESPVSPGAAAGSPFGPTPEFGTAAGPDNPYQSPSPFVYQGPPGQPDPYAAQRVSGPATALTVTAILGVVMNVLGTMANVSMLALGPMAGQPGANMRLRHEDTFPMMLGGGVYVALGLFGVAMSIIILIGARKMKRLEGHTFAMAAAIIALVPCISPCCLLGLPFGIWALVVLNDPSVKAAFRS
jgi:phage FluMu protein Com